MTTTTRRDVHGKILQSARSASNASATDGVIEVTRTPIVRGTDERGNTYEVGGHVKRVVLYGDDWTPEVSIELTDDTTVAVTFHGNDRVFEIEASGGDETTHATIDEVSE